MIVITYPRSGSDYLCNAINTFQTITYGNSIYLNEFNQLASFGTWRNIFHETKNLENEEYKKIKTLTLKNNLTLREQSFRNILMETDLVNYSKEQVYEFIDKEYNRRLEHLNQLRMNNIPYTIKLFPNTISSLPFEFEQEEKVLLYRKNLKECLLSRLIKFCHYDGKTKNEIGHNYSNNPAPKIDTQIVIPKDVLQHQVQTFCHLLTIYENCDGIPTISYEDMIDGKTILVSGKEMSPKEITEKYISRPEMKMDYSLTGNKEDFFTNPEIIPDIIEQEIDKAGVQDIINRLGIHW